MSSQLRARIAPKGRRYMQGTAFGNHSAALGMLNNEYHMINVRHSGGMHDKYTTRPSLGLTHAKQIGFGARRAKERTMVVLEDAVQRVS